MKKPILIGVICIIVGLCCWGSGKTDSGLTAFNYFGFVLFVAGIVAIVKALCGKKSLQIRQMPPTETAVKTGEMKTDTYSVAGMNYRYENVEAVGKKNPDFSRPASELIAEGKTDKRIYEYSFLGVQFSLKPEPSNPHDKNAIKILADGKHIGYISSDENQKALALMKSGRVKSVGGTMYGGSYKLFTPADQDYIVVNDRIHAKVYLTYQ